MGLIRFFASELSRDLPLKPRCYHDLNHEHLSVRHFNATTVVAALGRN